jgi:RNA polymerase sigma factor (sigma-70 family)
MDGTSFERGGAGEAREWVQPWRSEALRQLRPARERLELIESVRLPLYDLAKSVAQGGVSSDVDDLHQIGMEHALRLLPKYQPGRGATFLTFVFLRVRTLMKDSLKAENRDRACAAAAQRGTRAEPGARPERYELAAAAIMDCYPDPESPEERLRVEEEGALARRAIDQALLRLDKTAHALVRACFWEDQSVAEAARRLGLGYEDARYRLRSALGRIAKMLAARG